MAENIVRRITTAPSPKTAMTIRSAPARLPLVSMSNKRANESSARSTVSANTQMMTVTAARWRRVSSSCTVSTVSVPHGILFVLRGAHGVTYSNGGGVKKY